MSAALTNALDPARTVDPARYAMGGRAPGAALKPLTREEISEALRAAARESLGVVPWGAGVSLAHQPAPPRYDLALDLTALDRVIEYEPDDLTLTVECGATIASLRALVGPRNQELPLEASHAARATVGGVIAANASGARRYRFGAPRDRILGARFAMADGTLARTGGKVVKNVAGYALHRLACGSRGGLAIVLDASFKLATAPAKRVMLFYPASAAQIADAPRWAFLPRLEPAGVTVVNAAMASQLASAFELPASARGDYTVIIGLEDDAAWVDAQCERVASALGEPARRVEDASVIAWWQTLADLESAGGPRLTFATADNTPAALAPLNSNDSAARLVFHAPAGKLHLMAAETGAARHIDSLLARGFELIESSGAGEVRGTSEPLAAVAALRARIRSELDPNTGLALGERWITSR